MAQKLSDVRVPPDSTVKLTFSRRVLRDKDEGAMVVDGDVVDHEVAPPIKSMPTTDTADDVEVEGESNASFSEVGTDGPSSPDGKAARAASKAEVEAAASVDEGGATEGKHGRKSGRTASSQAGASKTTGAKKGAPISSASTSASAARLAAMTALAAGRDLDRKQAQALVAENSDLVADLDLALQELQEATAERERLENMSLSVETQLRDMKQLVLHSVRRQQLLELQMQQTLLSESVTPQQAAAYKSAVAGIAEKVKARERIEVPMEVEDYLFEVGLGLDALKGTAVDGEGGGGGGTDTDQMGGDGTDVGGEGGAVGQLSADGLDLQTKRSMRVAITAVAALGPTGPTLLKKWAMQGAGALQRLRHFEEKLQRMDPPAEARYGQELTVQQQQKQQRRVRHNLTPSSRSYHYRGGGGVGGGEGGDGSGGEQGRGEGSASKVSALGSTRKGFYEPRHTQSSSAKYQVRPPKKYGESGGEQGADCSDSDGMYHSSDLEHLGTSGAKGAGAGAGAGSSPKKRSGSPSRKKASSSPRQRVPVQPVSTSRSPSRDLGASVSPDFGASRDYYGQDIGAGSNSGRYYSHSASGRR